MSGLSPRQLACLRAMGVTIWTPQSAPQKAPPAAAVVMPAAVTALAESPAAPGIANVDDMLGALARRVSECRRCELHQGRTQTVFGVGDPAADLMIIGEAPGAEEDRQGEPFVGRAGKLLNEMLRAIGLQRREVYIANILKCRPPNNRDPKPEEAAECSEYLFQQIELIRPRLILVLGRIAAQRLLNTDTALARLRGKLHQHPQTGVPLVVTYHPAYLLRTPSDKRKAWQDLLFLRNTIKSL